MQQNQTAKQIHRCSTVVTRSSYSHNRLYSRKNNRDKGSTFSVFSFFFQVKSFSCCGLPERMYLAARRTGRNERTNASSVFVKDSRGTLRRDIVSYSRVCTHELRNARWRCKCARVAGKKQLLDHAVLSTDGKQRRRVTVNSTWTRWRTSRSLSFLPYKGSQW